MSNIISNINNIISNTIEVLHYISCHLADAFILKEGKWPLAQLLAAVLLREFE